MDVVFVLFYLGGCFIYFNSYREGGRLVESDFYVWEGKYKGIWFISIKGEWGIIVLYD